MTLFKDLPISKKLMRMSMVVSVPVLLLSCAAFVGYGLVLFKTTAAENLSTNAEIVSINVTPALLFQDRGAAAETLAALRATPNIISAAVYTPDGKLFAKYVRGFGSDTSALPEKLEVTRNTQRIDSDNLIVLRQILSDGKPVGMVYIQSDLKEIESRLQGYAAIAFGVLALSFMVALLVSSTLEKKISGPILSLAETTKTIVLNKDYSVRAAIESKDEIGILGGAFNKMLQQIEEQNETLRESEQNFRELANAMPQIVWTARADGESDYFNQQWFDYTGTTAEQTQAWGWSAALHPEDLPKCVEAWTKSIQTGTPFNMELRIRRASDETYRWHLGRALPVHDKRGQVIRWFGTYTDIDDQKRVEEEVRQLNTVLEQRVAERTTQLQKMNIELANANQAKNSFLASMSHELRTPMNAIIGFTGTLLMGLAGPLTVDQEKQLRTVQGSAKHLLALINDLLDLAKIEAGKVELKLEPTNCNAVVEEVVTTLRPQAEGKGLALQVTLPDQALTISADRRALSQIIINLANNAIKFTERGSVHLKVSPGEANGKRMVEFSVEDTGIGIRPEDQLKLFAAFAQVDQARRTREGTGLGLHLSQKLAGLLGGKITFRSEYGKGSTFTLALMEP